MDKEPIIMTIITTLLIIFFAFVIIVPLTNFVEKVNCDTMEQQGYEVDLYDETLLTKICLVKLDNNSKFIPYTKIRGIE